MSELGLAFLRQLDGADLAQLRALLRLETVTSEAPATDQASPWLDANEAAEYLRCPLSRVRKLTMTDEIPHAKDGRRVLYRREELDAYLAAGGARCV